MTAPILSDEVRRLAEGHGPIGSPRHLWSDNLPPEMPFDLAEEHVGPVELRPYRDVELWSDYMPHTANGPICDTDVYRPYVARYFANRPADRFPAVDRLRCIDEPVFVISHFNMSTYGHFLLEVLPKLLLARALRRSGMPIRIAFPDDAPRVPALNSICAADDLVTYASRRERLRMPLAWLPTQMTSLRHHLHRSFVALLKALVVELRVDGETHPLPGPRLFLSRARHRRSFRRLRNEAELYAVAADYGFHLVHPQEWSWPDQIRMFDRATHVIGEFTSALHNQVFSRPGTKIVSFGRLNPIATSVAASLGHEVGYLFPLGGVRIKYERGWTTEQVFDIDAAELRRRLDRLMA